MIRQFLYSLKGVSLNKWGKELGVTGSVVSSWEIGNKEPNFDMLKNCKLFYG